MEATPKLAKILLIEDSKNEFLLTQMLLRRENVIIDMDLTRSPAEALTYLKSNKPDLIVIDKRIAVLENNKFIKSIQKHKILKNIPVVMLFGIGDETAEINPYSCELGVNICLDKPLNHDKLSFITKQIDFLSFQASENQIYLCAK
jgi:response regulator RpfG family c-di-GMP phosphodiesterase